MSLAGSHGGTTFQGGKIQDYLPSFCKQLTNGSLTKACHGPKPSVHVKREDRRYMVLGVGVKGCLCYFSML